MKSRIWLATAFFGLHLFGATGVQAAMISYNGYSKADHTNIVRGDGLQWLRWDVTRGMSIQAALAAYQHEGWQLASNQQMAGLFNAFQFGKTDWTDAADQTQIGYTGWSFGEQSVHQLFISMFGLTASASCTQSGQTGNCYADTDRFEMAGALFGNDANQNGWYNLSSVADDHTYFGFRGIEQNAHQAAMWQEYYDRNWQNGFYGVALVRPGNSVPAPAGLAWLSLGLLGLRLLARRRKA